jgi:hypothetical protein
MNILKIDLSKLRNEEHYQFQTDFKKLVNQYKPASLSIVPQFQTYLPLYVDEIVALDNIRKSAITDDLAVADCIREATFRGMRDAMKAAGNHFIPEVKEAASRLQIVFDHYGNLTIKPFDEETAAINRLIIDLQDEYAADAAAIGINDWVIELKKNNDSFDDLKAKRYTEAANKTQLRMKEVRIKVDVAYHIIVNFINALIIVNGVTNYSEFVKELNKRIENYTLLYAHRKGRNGKNNNDTITDTK